VLDSLGLPYDEARMLLERSGECSVYELEVNGVCVTTMPTRSSRPDRAPGPDESRSILDLVNQALDRFRPDVVLTYGGHAASLELMAAARKRGIDVVFHLQNLHRMANTPDPRDFYRISRIMLVPSLIENAALVAREALANGIPVLASDRGGLPETLGDAGFVFTLPERLLAPGSAVIPTAQEVAPWVAAIEKLRDDPEFEAGHRRLALAEVQRWNAEVLVEQYQRFFGSLADARQSRLRGDSQCRLPRHSAVLRTPTKQPGSSRVAR
jgi:glycosyltransferase involved in cell wall biosynthesis